MMPFKTLFALLVLLCFSLPSSAQSDVKTILFKHCVEDTLLNEKIANVGIKIQSDKGKKWELNTQNACFNDTLKVKAGTQLTLFYLNQNYHQKTYGFKVQKDSTLLTTVILEAIELCIDRYIPLYAHFQTNSTNFSKNNFPSTLQNGIEMWLEGNPLNPQSSIELIVYKAYSEQKKWSKKRAEKLKKILTNAGINADQIKVNIQNDAPLNYELYHSGCFPYYFKDKSILINKENYCKEQASIQNKWDSLRSSIKIQIID